MKSLKWQLYLQIGLLDSCIYYHQVSIQSKLAFKNDCISCVNLVPTGHVLYHILTEYYCFIRIIGSLAGSLYI